MDDTIYSNKSGDPNKRYLVCKRIADKWHLVEEHEDCTTAVTSRNTLAEDDLIEGRITDTLFYKIFFKDLVEIKENI